MKLFSRSQHANPLTHFSWRHRFVLICFALGVVVLAARAIDIQVVRKSFYQNQGDARFVREVALSAHRGAILDRNGEPIAMSSPVDSVWANPSVAVSEGAARYESLAQLLEMPPPVLWAKIQEKAEREFVYLKRHVSPDVVGRIKALALPGIEFQREYRRFYPMGEVSGHLLGYTNVDDVGQEGLELAHDVILRGAPGSKSVIKDRIGNIIADVGGVREPRPGQDLVLSLDQRIQYLAYRELKTAVNKHQAKAGTAVVLDVRTGEVLAMVNQPTYNPNNRAALGGDAARNRAVTDLFEPGSTIKPFTVAQALQEGVVQPDTIMDTSPGTMQVGRHWVKDVHNYGVLDITGVIRKSSNVASAKMALAMEPRALYTLLHNVGFGELTGAGFPGEAEGVLVDRKTWRPIELATLSFGYGLSSNALQLAAAYAVFAADGLKRPVSLMRVNEPQAGTRVMDAQVARTVRQMMETVVSAEGTAVQASVPGYRVAGKTGTVRKLVGRAYSANYVSLFAGIVPASNPRFVMVIMVDEPGGGDYYGGLVAAPVFSKVMGGALRMMNVPPDAIPPAVPAVAVVSDHP
jgi:cell division protein FtsI (penicillin-binding protein 3)